MRPNIELPPGVPTSRFREPFTVQWASGSEVQVGVNLVPSVIYLTADVPARSQRPAITVRYEVIGGIVRCTDLHLWSERADQSIRPNVLEWVTAHFDDLRTEALTACVMKPNSMGGWSMAGTREEVRSEVRNMPRPTNRSLTDRIFLERVADVYNQNPVGGSEAVASAFGVKRAQSQKYVKAARDAGLIEDRRRNRLSRAAASAAGPE